MTQSDGISTAARSQQTHDDYPVHLIDLIQPFGLLMVLDWPHLTIERISQNSDDYLGIPALDLLDQPLSCLLAKSDLQRVQQTLEALSASSQPNCPTYLRLPFKTSETTQPFDSRVYFVKEKVVLEIEPADTSSAAAHIDRQAQVTQAIAHLRTLRDINEFVQAAVEQVQLLTGYDRVVIYQFDEKAAGAVIAEVKQPDQTSYLGLHYPATDIPGLVRQFYQEGMVRYVPDLKAPLVDLIYQPAPIGKKNKQKKNKQKKTANRKVLDSEPSDDFFAPIDLTQSVLRGIDPCCIESHQNMSVAGFLVIALVKDNQLWGLIACHHTTPKYLTYAVRSSAEVLGQFVAAALSSKVNEADAEYLTQLKAIQSDFIASISGAEDFKQALIHPQPRLLDLVNASGAAVCLDQDLTLLGDTPSRAQVQALIEWTLAEHDEDMFHTDSLSEVYPDAIAYKDTASGVLILNISTLRRYLILWFRPEVLQTVHWAGDPQGSIQKNEDGTVMLCPRNSYAQWQETVRATARPWKTAEIESAADLKNAIIGIVLNKADELAQMNQELSRSNRELDSFAYAASHDLKEPLRGITNFSNILLRRHKKSLDETGVKRLETLVRLAKRMDTLIDALLRFSRLGQAELHYESVDLNELVQKAIDDLLTGREGKKRTAKIEIVRSLPTVNCDPVLLGEVFTNLISNALKYTEKDKPIIKIGYLTQAEQLEKEWTLQPANISPIIYVQDNGIGIHKRHFDNVFRLFKRLHERESYGGGSGVGLTITHKIIERHGGRIWLESEQGQGTTFYFVLNYNQS